MSSSWVLWGGLERLMVGMKDYKMSDLYLTLIALHDYRRSTEMERLPTDVPFLL